MGLSLLQRIAPSGVPGWARRVFGQGGAQHLIWSTSRWQDVDRCIGGWARFWRGRFGCVASVRKSSVARVRSRTDRYAFPGRWEHRAALEASTFSRALKAGRLVPGGAGRTSATASGSFLPGSLGGHLFLPETGLVPPPSSPPLTVERPKGMWRSPPVDRAIAMQLCPQGSTAWRGNPRLPCRACKFSSALTAKAYGAARHGPPAGPPGQDVEAVARGWCWPRCVAGNAHSDGPRPKGDEFTARALGQTMSRERGLRK